MKEKNKTNTIKSKRTKEALSRAKELGESEGHYQMYFNHSPNGLFVVDSKGRYIEVNDAACRMTGYSMEELTSLSISDLIAPEQLVKGLKDFEKLLNTGCLSTELLLRCKDGTKFLLQLDAVKISDDRYIGFTKDITRRKQAEKALKVNERNLQAIIDSSTAVIYVKDLDGNYVLVNRWYETLFHVNREEVKGKTDHEVFPKDMADAFRANDLKVLRKKSSN